MLTDTDLSEKQRTPSWTDRILWLSVHDGAVKSLKYTSHPEITLSDHKPVSSVFSLQVKRPSRTARRAPLTVLAGPDHHPRRAAQGAAGGHVGV